MEEMSIATGNSNYNLGGYTTQDKVKQKGKNSFVG